MSHPFPPPDPEIGEPFPRPEGDNTHQRPVAHHTGANPDLTWWIGRPNAHLVMENTSAGLADALVRAGCTREQIIFEDDPLDSYYFNRDFPIL